MRFVVLLNMLIGCTFSSYHYPEYETCKYDECSLSYSGGELCCDDYDCWYRADGMDFIMSDGM